MLERLKKLDPNSSNIYGPFTSHLVQQHQQQPLSMPQQSSSQPIKNITSQQKQLTALPPINPTQNSNYMQGIEYQQQQPNRPSYEMR